MLQTIERISERRPRILVVGDIILDVYRFGSADRISREAPVPVLRYVNTQWRLGGAAAVAAMCAALGARTYLAGVVGDDSNGRIVLDLIEKQSPVDSTALGRKGNPDWIQKEVRRVLDANHDGFWHFITTETDRPTTTKERLIGIVADSRVQQIARLDHESTHDIPASTAGRFLGLARSLAGFVDDSDFPLNEDGIDAILVADYGLGVCTDQLISGLKKLRVPIIVDPPRNHRWHKYGGVDCIIPNRHEANGMGPEEIRTTYGLGHCLVKMDREGAMLADAEGQSHYPAHFCDIHDVTGAGDQVLATLGCAVGAGLTYAEGTELAMLAAGLQVQRQGCDPVLIDDLRQAAGGPVAVA